MCSARTLFLVILAGSLLALPRQAVALSEIQPAPPASDAPETIERVPLPAPLRLPTRTGPQSEAETQKETPAETPGDHDATRPNLGSDVPTPTVNYDLQQLPEPVRRMHRLIVEASKTGDLEQLRPLIGPSGDQTRLSLGGFEGDPVDFLRELSGDEEGQEIMAILLEVLQAGYVHLDPDTPHEMYVWPYFFALPLEKLDKRQRVELFTLVTAGDYEDMKSFGAYIFYRVGITPEGRWSFFVAGD